MKALITGATGFIGSRLALRMLERGDQVRILGLCRDPVERETADQLTEAGAESVVGSITDPDHAAAATDSMEVVFHLAAAQHEANVPDKHFWDVNVEGTRNLLDASVAAGVRRFVHGSSIGVFGWSSGRTIHDDSPLDPDNIYGTTKLAGEEVVRSYRDRLRLVIIRISEVYGPGDRRLIKLFRGVKKGRFPVIGSGENLHHLIFIDDLLDGLLAAATSESAEGKTFVLAGEAPVTTTEMIRAAADQLGCKPPRLWIPMAPLLALATVMEHVLRPLGIQPPLHRRRMNFFRKSFAFSMDEAQAAIGFAPKVGLEDGMAATASWYEEEGLLE